MVEGRAVEPRLVEAAGNVDLGAAVAPKTPTAARNAGAQSGVAVRATTMMITERPKRPPDVRVVAPGYHRYWRFVRRQNNSCEVVEVRE